MVNRETTDVVRSNENFPPQEDHQHNKSKYYACFDELWAHCGHTASASISISISASIKDLTSTIVLAGG